MNTWPTMNFDTSSLFPELSKYNKFFVGSDQILKQFQDAIEQSTKAITSYPPYNIKQTEENKYVVEMAVAGFGKQNLELTLDGNRLVIAGNMTSTDDEYVHKGIAERSFTRQFTLADNVTIENADLLNGMLKIWLNAVVPAKTVKKIDINDKPIDIATVNEKVFLTEKEDENDK